MNGSILNLDSPEMRKDSGRRLMGRIVSEVMDAGGRESAFIGLHHQQKGLVDRTRCRWDDGIKTSFY